jgi:hypothetical protein
MAIPAKNITITKFTITIFVIAFIMFEALSFFAVTEKTVRKVQMKIPMNKIMIMMINRFCMLLGIVIISISTLYVYFGGGGVPAVIGFVASAIALRKSEELLATCELSANWCSSTVKRA